MTRLAVLVLLAAAVLPGLALATPEHLATIESECGKQLKMSPAECTCLKDTAAALSEGQQAFIAAVVSKDKALQRDLTQNMTVGELTQVGMFMTNAPAQCANAQ